MQYEIKLSEQAFQAYRQRAEKVGLNVDEYLNQSAARIDEADGFSLTPEVRTAIEKALAEADAGELLTMDQVRESLTEYKAKWREENQR